MEVLEKIMEMRGMHRSEITNYFLSINGEDNGFGKFTGEGWEVEVGEEKSIAICSLILSATIVSFRCRKDLLEPMLSAFRMRFLSAGG